MSVAINRAVLLKTRTGPTETVSSGEAYFWLEGQSLKYKDDTQTTYTLSSGVTPEEVQDIVGAFISAGSSKVVVTYNDVANTLTIDLNQSNIDHDALLNFVSDEHVAHSSVSISAGTSLNGGGNITASRTINHNTFGTAATYGSATQIPVFTTESTGHVSGVTNTAIAIPSTQVTDFTEAAQDAVGGALVDSTTIDFTYTDASNQITVTVIPGGVNHNALLNGGGNTHIDHSTVSITAGAGLTGGGDITASRSLAIATTGVTATSYGSASSVATFTVNALGQLTTAATTAISILSAAVTDFAATVRSTLLTGFTVGANVAIAATDTILQAFGKIQGQINQINADTAVWTELVTTADILNNSNTTLSNVTELQFAVVSGRSYYIEATVIFRAAATTTGLALTFGTPDTAAGTFAAQVNIPIAADGTAAIYGGNISSLGDLVVATGVQTAQPTWFVANVKGVFVATASGNLLPQFRSEVNGSNVNFGTGSVILVREFT